LLLTTNLVFLERQLRFYCINGNRNELLMNTLQNFIGLRHFVIDGLDEHTKGNHCCSLHKHNVQLILEVSLLTDTDLNAELAMITHQLHKRQYMYLIFSKKYLIIDEFFLPRHDVVIYVIGVSPRVVKVCERLLDQLLND